MRASVAANLLYFPATRLGGERVREYLKEYRRHDGMTEDELTAYQSSRLRDIVSLARHDTQHFGLSGESTRSDLTSERPELAGIPFLTKEILRESPEVCIARSFRGRVEKKTTSGSTGHPVTVRKDSDALARERAATWRSYAWAGVSVAAPQALLWGQPYSFAGRLRATALDFLANRRRLSMFGVTDQSLANYYARMVRFEPEYIYGYVSAVVTFLEYVRARNWVLPKSVRCIITTSELLDPDTRRHIENLSGLPVFNEYGCGEVGSIAHDCEFGRLHVMSDNLVVECVPVQGAPDGMGEFVVTDLHNRAMPLLRYRLGDLGRLSTRSCECGRPYPVIERIVGRAYDVVFDAAGRAFHPEAVLYVFESLRRQGVTFPPFQAVQRVRGELEIVFQTDEDIPDCTKNAVLAEFNELIGGGLSVSFGATRRLPRERSGKLRVVKSELAGQRGIGSVAVQSGDVER